MSDKMRGALFNMLGDLDGLTVLDAFAGSGALSFEAVSRGATSAIAIDNDQPAQRAIRHTITQLGLEDRVTLIAAAAHAWLQTSPAVQFDIVLCDPPYTDVQLALLARLATKVKPGGLMVLSWPGGREAPTFEGLSLIDQCSYGDAQLIFYRAGA